MAEGWDFVIFAVEQAQEDMIFQRWLHFQHISYDEFKGELTGVRSKNNEKPVDVLNKVRDILDGLGVGYGDF